MRTRAGLAAAARRRRSQGRRARARPPGPRAIRDASTLAAGLLAGLGGGQLALALVGLFNDGHGRRPGLHRVSRLLLRPRAAAADRARLQPCSRCSRRDPDPPAARTACRPSSSRPSRTSSSSARWPSPRSRPRRPAKENNRMRPHAVIRWSTRSATSSIPPDPNWYPGGGEVEAPIARRCRRRASATCSSSTPSSAIAPACSTSRRPKLPEHCFEGTPASEILAAAGAGHARARDRGAPAPLLGLLRDRPGAAAASVDRDGPLNVNER